MRVTNRMVMSLLALCTAAGCVALGLRTDPYHPHVDPADFGTRVDNPYFPLVPGTTVKFIEKSPEGTMENEIEVTHDTKMIMGVQCVVVHDVVSQNGVLKEDTYDWYAQDKAGTVWYFGEATKEFKPGGRVSTEGSWEAGVNGQPGIIMPANPQVGEPYRQEYSPGNAEDMGQVVGVNDSVTVPYGTFTGCVKTEDWSMLEAGSENKWYAKGLGVVRAESTAGEVAVLVSVTRP